MKRNEISQEYFTCVMAKPKERNLCITIKHNVDMDLLSTVDYYLIEGVLGN